MSHHETLRDCFESIARELLDVDTPEAIRQLVYDRVVPHNRYRFVWLATYVSATEQLKLHVPTETIVAPTEFTSLIGATDAGFIRKAATDATVETAHGEATMRGAATFSSEESATTVPAEPSRSERGSMTAAVPFVHDQAVHGLLLLTTTAGDMAATERELLSDLGRLVGKALAAVSTDGVLTPEGFADVVVHELVNPLTVAQVSLDQGRETGESEWLEKVDRALRRMEHVLTDELALLQGANIESQTLGNLEADAAEAWAMLDTENAELIVESVPEIHADHALVECLLSNLFDNALTHGGDSVTVRVGTLWDGFFIADDGVGIPDDEHSHVFEFGYTNGAGTGLGLTMVERIVEAHGWTIHVTESEEGGAQFEIRGVETGEQP